MEWCARGTANQTRMLNIQGPTQRLAIATDTGRGTRKGAVRKVTAADQTPRAEALDQAEPRKWRIHVAKEASRQEIQRRSREAR